MNTAEEILNLQQEISNLKKDIEFLSKKVGVHDMYLNRLNKEREREKEEEVFQVQKYSAEEMIKIVMNLSKWKSNEERQKFLSEMFYEFYNNESIPRVEEDWE